MIVLFELHHSNLLTLQYTTCSYSTKSGTIVSFAQTRQLTASWNLESFPDQRISSVYHAEIHATCCLYVCTSYALRMHACIAHVLLIYHIWPVPASPHRILYSLPCILRHWGVSHAMSVGCLAKLHVCRFRAG